MEQEVFMVYAKIIWELLQEPDLSGALSMMCVGTDKLDMYIVKLCLDFIDGVFFSY